MKIPHMSRRKLLKNISYSALASRLDLIGESIPLINTMISDLVENGFTKADHIINLRLKNHGS